MSKSKFNGVSPIDLKDKYGCDNLKMSLLFYGPNENDITWEESI